MSSINNTRGLNIVNISIQLDEQHVKKIHYLEQQLNMQLDSLIQKGIDVLYEQQQHKSSKAFQILRKQVLLVVWKVMAIYQKIIRVGFIWMINCDYC